MPHFFAEFKQVGSLWIRHDTRIYLSDFAGTPGRGHCLGAIVGKNPGSAKAIRSGWGPLELDGDKMLPNVRNILVQAFDRAGKASPPNAYFGVLNLFYICGHDLSEATAACHREQSAYEDRAESESLPLVWYAWGGPSKSLDSLKTRFLKQHEGSSSFFYCPRSQSIFTRPPDISEFAKHPQGLLQEPVVLHLAAHFAADF